MLSGEQGKVVLMTSLRIKLVPGVALAGLMLALVPTVAASASQDIVAKSTTHYGSDPTSAFCVAVKNEQSGVSQNSSTIKSEMASNKLSLVKKASLEIYGIDAQAARNVQATVHSAPAAVKSAVAETLQFEATLKSIIEKAKSLPKLEAAETAAASSPKVAAAGKVLTAYFDSKCDTRTTTP